VAHHRRSRGALHTAGRLEVASNDEGGPEVVLACCGDVPTMEALAAVTLLRERAPDLRIRVVNVVDLMALQQQSNIRMALR